ncbi:unnamed protein product [Microthlaspi erraticum]|uniref:Uncharacterized protein n=1 Tax=Microthlaspi erraticum TaxID=1685480 RepID=A0A6D2LL15_9BRAS|nr:unnamed protein product [Microthlaspi erraticum]CAA7062142.1 unnamed protein product [Microthlaspi erraticum]
MRSVSAGRENSNRAEWNARPGDDVHCSAGLYYRVRIGRQWTTLGQDETRTDRPYRSIREVIAFPRPDFTFERESADGAEQSRHNPSAIDQTLVIHTGFNRI